MYKIWNYHFKKLLARTFGCPEGWSLGVWVSKRRPAPCWLRLIILIAYDVRGCAIFVDWSLRPAILEWGWYSIRRPLVSEGRAFLVICNGLQGSKLGLTIKLFVSCNPTLTSFYSKKSEPLSFFSPPPTPNHHKKFWPTYPIFFGLLQKTNNFFSMPKGVFGAEGSLEFSSGSLKFLQGAKSSIGFHAQLL